MGSSFFIPVEKLANFIGDGMMSSEGIHVLGVTDPSMKRLLPPPLELADPDNPTFYTYVVNIRESSFGPWYMEGSIGLLARYGERIGLYFLSLQLSGPGALMAVFTGREGAGLPKKLCEHMVVERTDTYGHCCIERNGVRLLDVELEIGQYNHPAFHQAQENCQATPGGIVTEGGCLLHRYRLDDGFKDMEFVYYDSPTRYYSWEPAAATVKLTSSMSISEGKPLW